MYKQKKNGILEDFVSPKAFKFNFLHEILLTDNSNKSFLMIKRAFKNKTFSKDTLY